MVKMEQLTPHINTRNKKMPIHTRSHRTQGFVIYTKSYAMKSKCEFAYSSLQSFHKFPRTKYPILKVVNKRDINTLTHITYILSHHDNPTIWPIYKYLHYTRLTVQVLSSLRLELHTRKLY